jgi:hypothetical protein
MNRGALHRPACHLHGLSSTTAAQQSQTHTAVAVIVVRARMAVLQVAVAHKTARAQPERHHALMVEGHQALHTSTDYPSLFMPSFASWMSRTASLYLCQDSTFCMMGTSSPGWNSQLRMCGCTSVLQVPILLLLFVTPPTSLPLSESTA